MESIGLSALGQFSAFVLDSDQFVEFPHQTHIFALAADSEFDHADQISQRTHLVLQDIGPNVHLVHILVDCPLQLVHLHQQLHVLRLQGGLLGDQVLL